MRNLLSFLVQTSKTVSPTAFMVHGDSITMANEPFQKGLSLEGAAGDKKWIVLSKPGEPKNRQNPSVGHEKLLFNLDSRTIIDKPN